MAGHAPELLPPGRRLAEWFFRQSDAAVSLYMMIASLVILAALWVVDQGWLR